MGSRGLQCSSPHRQPRTIQIQPGITSYSSLSPSSFMPCLLMFLSESQNLCSLPFTSWLPSVSTSLLLACFYFWQNISKPSFSLFPPLWRSVPKRWQRKRRGWKIVEKQQRNDRPLKARKRTPGASWLDDFTAEIRNVEWLWSHKWVQIILTLLWIMTAFF